MESKNMIFIEFLVLVLFEQAFGLKGTGDIKIVGFPADIKEYPFIGSLRKREVPLPYVPHHICNLVLVSELAAITAGHCFAMDTCLNPTTFFPVDVKTNKYYAIWGANTIPDHFNPDDDPGSAERLVQRVFFHRELQINETVPLYYEFDLAVIMFAKVPLKYGSKINAVTFYYDQVTAANAWKRANYTGRTECDLMGYGAINDPLDPDELPDSPTKLQQLPTTIIDENRCCGFFAHASQKTCIHKIGKASTGIACHLMSERVITGLGDSGAPVVCYERGTPKLMGLHIGVMVNRECASFIETKPTPKCEHYRVLGAYVDHDTIVSWLDDELASAIHWPTSGQIKISSVATIVAAITGFLILIQ